MTEEMQHARILQILQAANPDLDDPYILPGTGNREWWDDLDPQLTLSENIEALEKLHPQLKWRMPEDSKLRSVYARSKEITRHAGPDSRDFILECEAVIKPMMAKAKGKTYPHGRIQITLEKFLIGKTARVSITVPHAYESIFESPFSPRTLPSRRSES